MIQRYSALKTALLPALFCLAAAWVGAVVLQGQASTQLKLQVVEQLRTTSSLTARQIAQNLDSEEPLSGTEADLRKAVEASESIKRLFVISGTDYDKIEVVSDTRSNLESPRLPDRSEFQQVSRGIVFVPSQESIGHGASSLIAYAPLVNSEGQWVGTLGLVYDSNLLVSRLGGLNSVFTIVIIAALVLFVVGILAVLWHSRESSRTKQPINTKLLKGAEGALVLVLCWSTFHAVQGQSRFHFLSQAQSGQVKLLEGLSQAVAAIELPAGSPPVAEAAARLSETSRPWLASSFLQAKRDGDISALLSLLSHQSLVAASQTETVRSAMETASTSIRENLIVLAAAGLGLSLLIRSRRRRERYLESKAVEGEENMNRLVRAMPIGLGTFTKTHMDFCNPAWEYLVGSDAEGSDSEWSKSIHPSDLSKVLTGLENPTQHDEGPVFCRLLTPDSQVRHLALRFAPLGSEGENDERCLVFALDVTEEQRAREALDAQIKLVDEKSSLLALALDDLEENLESVVHCLVRAVEAKDPYTAGHSERVAEYSVRIGKYLGLGPFELRILELGALVHDVGKIGIPDAVLGKPDRLTEEEFEIIKTHPAVGEEILKRFRLFKDCLPIVRWHHERLNGTGYPDGLMADEIPFLVRISAVADAFDAMTSNRAYRAGMPAERAIEILVVEAESGKMDPMVVEALKRSLGDGGVIPQIEPNTIGRRAA